MRVKALKSNMTLVQTAKADVLVSYETPVAACIHDQGYIRTSTKWSVTTSRHINQWLKGVKAQEVEQSVLDELLDN